MDWTLIRDFRSEVTCFLAVKLSNTGVTSSCVLIGSYTYEKVIQTDAVVLLYWEYK